MDRIKGNIHYSMSKIDFRWYMNYDFPLWYRRLHSWWYFTNKGHTVYGIFIVFLTLHACKWNCKRVFCWRVTITALSFRWSGRTNEIEGVTERDRERERKYYNLPNPPSPKIPNVNSRKVHEKWGQCLDSRLGRNWVTTGPGSQIKQIEVTHVFFQWMFWGSRKLQNVV